jgi:hypothetical protein
MFFMLTRSDIGTGVSELHNVGTFVSPFGSFGSFGFFSFFSLGAACARTVTGRLEIASPVARTARVSRVRLGSFMVR